MFIYQEANGDTLSYTRKKHFSKGIIDCVVCIHVCLQITSLNQVLGHLSLQYPLLFED
jgi:hypothetical protein